MAAKLFIGNTELRLRCSLYRELEFSIVGCHALSDTRPNQPCTSLAKPDSSIVQYIGKFSPGKISPKQARMYLRKKSSGLISPHE